MARLRYDNSLGTISDNPLASGATTINFTSAPSWATLAAGDYIPLVLEPPSGSGPSANFEIVHVTAYTAGTTTATISRGQEGTSAVAHATGSAWEVGPLSGDTYPPDYLSAVAPDFWLPSTGGSGLISTLTRREVTSAATAPLSSGRLSCVALPYPLRAGVTYSGIAVLSGGTAAATPTHQWFALIRASDRTYLRSTVDDTSTVWASNSLKALALSSTYTPTTDTWVYLGIMVAATTVPQLSGVAVQQSGIVPIYAGTSSTGLTTPVADGTVAAALTPAAQLFYAYVY